MGSNDATENGGCAGGCDAPPQKQCGAPEQHPWQHQQKGQLKSPPELLADDNRIESPSAPTMSLESKLGPNSARGVKNGSLSLEPKENLADSLLEELRKQSNSAASTPVKSTPVKSPVKREAEDVISNLEDSYFAASVPQQQHQEQQQAQHHQQQQQSCQQQHQQQLNETRINPQRINNAEHDGQAAGGHAEGSSEEVRTAAGAAAVESRKEKSERPRTDEELRLQEEEDFQRAIKESMSPQFRRRRNAAPEGKVIVLDDSDDDEGDAKMPAGKVKKEWNDPEGGRDEDDLAKAIRLSLEEAKKPSQPFEIQPVECRSLTRDQFLDAVDSFVWENGGYEKIEKGILVKHGNANDMKKQCVAAGGGKRQTSAQVRSENATTTDWRVVEPWPLTACFSFAFLSRSMDVIGTDAEMYKRNMCTSSFVMQRCLTVECCI